ncbi:hypothetical protein [Polaromonas sp. A23]|uniref:hypothetical protein n=1 Tax=Polaromonas sp. A23 TaxID=1944133 RepID=UPI001115AC77|nr:hypothetical protein [Polaromonas sp. A23]
MLTPFHRADPLLQASLASTVRSRRTPDSIHYTAMQVAIPTFEGFNEHAKQLDVKATSLHEN